MKPIRLIISFFAIFCLISIHDISSLKAYAGNDKSSIFTAKIKVDLYEVLAISDKKCVVVGRNGVILRSEDSGDTWERIQSTTLEHLFSITSPDGSSIWVAGSNGVVLCSADGGRTWNKQESGTDKHLFGIHFIDERIGCAVGDWGTILVTNDGGNSWKEASYSEDVILYDVAAVNKSNILIVGEFGRIIQVNSDGKLLHLTPDATDQKTLFCVDVNNGLCLAGGMDGVLIYSENQGKNWERLDSIFSEPVYGVQITEELGIAVGAGGAIACSSDKIAGWKHISPFQERNFNWLSSISTYIMGETRYFFLVGENGIIHRFTSEQIKRGDSNYEAGNRN